MWSHLPNTRKMKNNMQAAQIRDRKGKITSLLSLHVSYKLHPACVKSVHLVRVQRSTIWKRNTNNEKEHQLQCRSSACKALLGRVLVAHKLGEEKIVGKLFHDQQVVVPPLGITGWQIALPFLHQFPLDHQSFSHSLLMVESEILD
nr:uncharacterized protein LOC114825563 [Malus domestica]